MPPVSRRRFLQAAALSLAFACALPAWSDPEAASAEKELFDGKTLAGWKATAFAGAGEVAVEDGKIILPAGEPLTGVNYTGAMPKTNYELSLDAMKVEGSDFFCGLTFPIGATFVTFVVGGWGGGVVGISSINGEDASENETTQFKKFDNGKWVHVRLRVTAAKLEAWLDKEQVVNLPLEDKKLGMRIGEIELSQPCGIASFRTKAALKNIKLRILSEAAK